MLAAYLAMLIWQTVWHRFLPQPLGSGNTWLALVASLPLLIPLAGFVRGNYRSMIWAGLLMMLYFTIGVMEAWSNPPQRLPAMVQIVLPVLYLFAFKRRNQQRL
ncbi:MAG: DUF2069 domain-containing protein [Lysobacterales bacterium]